MKDREHEAIGLTTILHRVLHRAVQHLQRRTVHVKGECRICLNNRPQAVFLHSLRRELRDGLVAVIERTTLARRHWRRRCDRRRCSRLGRRQLLCVGVRRTIETRRGAQCRPEPLGEAFISFKQPEDLKFALVLEKYARRAGFEPYIVDARPTAWDGSMGKN